jgi:hypothetical protein
MVASFLCLDSRFRWIAGLALLLVAVGAPVLGSLAIVCGATSIAVATPLRRLAILLTSGAFYLYVLCLWPIVLEHEIVGFEVSRMIGWGLLAGSLAAFVVPSRALALLARIIRAVGP